MSTQVKAIAKGISQSPRKVSVVASLVRGRTVEDALVILQHTPRRSSKAVYKVISSAKANAIHNNKLKEDSLVISEIAVTAGPRIKRYRPAAHGRALPFQRKTSHIRVIVSGEVKPKKAKPAKASTKVTKKESK